MNSFINVVHKYDHINELTPEIMHELIEKIVVHAPDNSRGYCTQKIEIHFRFGVAVANAVQEVLDIADEVTASNDEDRVALWLEKNVLA